MLQDQLLLATRSEAVHAVEESWDSRVNMEQIHIKITGLWTVSRSDCYNGMNGSKLQYFHCRSDSEVTLSEGGQTHNYSSVSFMILMSEATP